MKVALVFPNNLYTSPYLPYYTQLLEKEMVQYEIISWNRNNLSEPGTIAFTQSNPQNSRLLRILDYFKFRKFIISVLEKNQYDKLIVFTCQLGIYLQGYLQKNFSNRYVLDVRDYSPMVPYFSKRIKKLVKHSSSVNLSSNGFKTWLPPQGDYVLSHNVNINLVTQALGVNTLNKSFFANKAIHVDTIGQIKDFESDKDVVSVLRNNDQFHLKFIGFGITLSRLKEFVEQGNIKNVAFLGPYKKEEEKGLLEKTDFINILISDNTFNNQVLSNRIYLSALLKIPCLVNDYTVQQREIIEKFKFGIVIREYEKIPERIQRFKEHFQSSEFEQACNNFLKEVVKDHAVFEGKLMEFIKD